MTPHEAALDAAHAADIRAAWDQHQRLYDLATRLPAIADEIRDADLRIADRRRADAERLERIEHEETP